MRHVMASIRAKKTKHFNYSLHLIATQGEGATAGEGVKIAGSGQGEYFSVRQNRLKVYQDPSHKISLGWPFVVIPML